MNVTNAIEDIIKMKINAINVLMDVLIVQIMKNVNIV